jgi:hypothetical protein
MHPSFQYNSYWIPPSPSGPAATELTLPPPASTAQTSSAAFSADDWQDDDQDDWQAWMCTTARDHMQAETTLANPLEELHDYLNSSLVDFRNKEPDLIGWWGVSCLITIALAVANPRLPSFSNTPSAIQPLPV